jgi:hypothetical protein
MVQLEEVYLELKETLYVSSIMAIWITTFTFRVRAHTSSVLLMCYHQNVIGAKLMTIVTCEYQLSK